MVNDRPNLIFILADDMGYGDFGCFGDGTPETPNLDLMVDSSVVMTNHYSASPVCSPARAALLTGKYPQSVGVLDTFESTGKDRIALSETLFPEILKNHGYATGLMGKWHSGAIGADYHPLKRGFNEFVGFRGGWSPYYKYQLDWNGEFRPSDGTYLTEVITQESINFIKTHQNEPFYLFVSYNAPHNPLEAPRSLIQKYMDKGANRKVATIYAMIEIMDRGIGGILGTLDNLNLRGNTMVVFTSDNGPKLDSGLNRFNCHLKGMKKYVFEGGIKVPAVINWKDHYPRKGKVLCKQFMHGTDWFPTLLAAMGIKPPEDLGFDGQNLFPILSQNPASPEISMSLNYNLEYCWQWSRDEPVLNVNSAIRVDNFKLVHPPIPYVFRWKKKHSRNDIKLRKHPEKFKSFSKGRGWKYPLPRLPRPELYNIQDDPLEQHNLVQSDPEKVDELEKKLLRWFRTIEQKRKQLKF